jgi:hypothetical protein
MIGRRDRQHEPLKEHLLLFHQPFPVSFADTLVTNLPPSFLQEI